MHKLNDDFIAALKEGVLSPLLALVAPCSSGPESSSKSWRPSPGS